MKSDRRTKARRDGVIFLDKDGTLVEDIPYNVDPDRIRLLPGVKKGLWTLAALGYPLVLISNQPGVARGYFPVSALDAVYHRIMELAEVRFAGFYFCPHHPSGSVARYALSCTCRKPAPGLLHRASRALGAKLANSWMIGDILNDMEAGRRAGCSTILVNNGGETRWELTPQRRPHYLVDSFEHAAGIVKAQSEAIPDMN